MLKKIQFLQTKYFKKTYLFIEQRIQALFYRTLPFRQKEILFSLAGANLQQTHV